MAEYERKETHLMELYQALALLFVKQNSHPGDSPEKLLAMFRDAQEKIINCDREHKGKPFSLE